MQFIVKRKDQNTALSVFLLEQVLLLYIDILAVSVITTHVAQIIGLPFRYYAYLLLVFLVFLFKLKLYKDVFPVLNKDYLGLFGIVALASFCAYISVYFHRIGRISPDEFYYAANPVYLLSHPDEPMGYQIYTFYSRQVFFSISYLTAGAYEYFLAAIAFLLNVKFAEIYYEFGASITGFLIVISNYLLLTKFTGKTEYALGGTLGIVSGIFLMGEMFWNPGAYAFMRAFEGKSFFLFAGIPTFAFLSINFLATGGMRDFVQLFLLSIAFSGLTTTSIPVVPLLAGILFFSFALSGMLGGIHARRFIPLGFKYLLSQTYLFVFGLCVFLFEDRAAGLFFNQDYNFAFSEYLKSFIYYNLPTTPLLFIISSLAVLCSGFRSKTYFIVFWMFGAIAFVLNPIVASFYLNLFPGIYSRFFYIFPFPLTLGVMFVYGLHFMERYPLRLRLISLCLTLFLTVVLPLKWPTSIFRLGNYSSGKVLDDQLFLNAEAVIRRVPQGVMLAPYPLSGAIGMLNGDYPQMLHRPDILRYYLSEKSSLNGALRVRVLQFLNEETEDYPAFLLLIQSHPEIRSIVLGWRVYYRFKDELEPPLTGLGFSADSDSGLIILTR